MTPRQLLARDVTGGFVRTHRVTEAFGCLFSGTRSPCKSAGTEFGHPHARRGAPWDGGSESGSKCRTLGELEAADPVPERPDEARQEVEDPEEDGGNEVRRTRPVRRTARPRAPAEVAGEARVITFVDTLAWASPVQETQGPCLRAF